MGTACIITQRCQRLQRLFRHLLCVYEQVVGCYPKEIADFAAELMQLLDTHHAVLDAGLRQTLVKALILMRNRGQACRPA